MYSLTSFANLPFFVSIPHSGERVPDFCTWLQNLPEPLLMCDVDRYVDRLYASALAEFGISQVLTTWHRYAADLNRLPEDVDAGSVQGHSNAKGSFARGFHWQMTTKREALMSEPMTADQHRQLVDMIYEPFHKQIRSQYEGLFAAGFKQVYHLDLHSMPSVGTSEHRDPGELRADIVVSDCKGQSSRREFVDLVIAAYVRAGFKVAYNWPYFGGRVSEQYGLPAQRQHCVQVELNRALYMDENSKQILTRHTQVQQQLRLALQDVGLQLQHLVAGDV